MLGILLVVSLLLVAIPGTVGGASGVGVKIIECGEEMCPITPGTVFGVKAEITNYDWHATDGNVTVTCNVSGNASLVSPSPINIGVLDAGEMDTVAFMVECTAPGSATITVSNNYSGSDSCTVDQRDPPALVAGMECPCESCTNCNPDDEFEIDAWVYNPGDVDASNVRLTITRSPTDGAHIVGSTEKWIGDLAAGQTKYIDVKWDAVCDLEGPVVFTVTPAGENACTHELIDPVTPDTCTVEQEDVLVDITCVLGLDSSGEGACGETCPQESDIMSTDPDGDHDQQFIVTASVTNCTDQPKDLNIQLVPPTGTAIVGETAHVYCPGVPYDDDLPLTTPEWTVEVDGVCGCCEVLVTWLLECTEATSWQKLVVNVDDGNSGNWDNIICDAAALTQVDKAHLVTTMTPWVGNCDCNPRSDEVTAVAVDQDFDVKINIANTGDALADNVEVDLKVEGDTDCVGTYYIQFPDIPGSDNRSVWLSDWVKGLDDCDCTGTDQVKVSILDIRGDDANTCEDIPGENIDPVCPLLIKQCDVDIELINPITCTNICVGDFFAVKAKLTNCGPCDLRNVEFTLEWDGDGPGSINLASEESENWTKTIAEILAPLPECPEPCTVYEVTWNVQCTGAGDVNLWVCAESETCGEPPPWPELTVKTPVATIHQVPPPDVSIDIVSPDNLDTFIATSQDFAVTAVITNNLSDWDISVMPFLSWYPEEDASIIDGPDPDVPIIIAEGEQETVTWTVHCEDEGALVLFANAVAFTEPECRMDFACDVPLVVWQYPTAHLEVEILGQTPTSVNVCDEFDVHYRVTNTGQADATEVEAVMTVTPEGSARPAAGIDSGYTQYIGTLTGHGQDETELGVYEGIWTMHCKEACESTIEITPEGYDEYGWHKKQECQSTGNFIVESGCLMGEITAQPGHATPNGWTAGIFIGEASGLIGPFNLTTPVAWQEFSGPQYTGNMTAMGAVIPNVTLNPGEHNDLIDLIDGLLCSGPCDGTLLEFLEDLGMAGIDKDVMIIIGQLEPDWGQEIPPDLDFTMCAPVGLMQIINGQVVGADLLYGSDDGVFMFLGGTYCSTMAKEALRPIDDKFIEPASVTVKQLPPEADLEIEKSASTCEAYIGDVVHFYVDVYNDGPSDATSIKVSDVLPAGVSYVDSEADQGWYDPMSGIWDIGDMEVGDDIGIDIMVTINSVGKHYNRATIIASDQHDSDTSDNSDMIMVTGMAFEIDTVDLEVGMNLVSLPKIPDNPDIATMLTGLPVTAVAYWTGGPEGVGEWWYYYPGDPGGSTLEFDELNDGKGYWVRKYHQPMIWSKVGTYLASSPPQPRHRLNTWLL